MGLGEGDRATEPSLPDEFSELAELLRDVQEFPGDRDADPDRRRRRRRRRFVAAIVTVVVLALIGGYAGWTQVAAPSPPAVFSHDPVVSRPSAAEIALPPEGASAVSIAGADDYLGKGASGIWARTGGNHPRPMASISKLLTALVVLDAHPLKSAEDPGPTIWFSKADHDLYDKYYVMDATIVAMPTGSRMSLHDALATMLIPSAANYAEAVSTWAFGSQGRFVNAARRWLAANRLTGTTMVEPTGLNPRNASTPTDLIKIGKLAAANPVIASITSTRALSLPGRGAIFNTNGLLGTDGITGLKTGNLGPGRYNLLYTASIDVGAGKPLSVTGVVLGGETHRSVDAEVVALLDSIRGGFHQVPVATRGQQVGAYLTPWGSHARMVIAEDASILTWSDTPITVTMHTTRPRTYADGEVIGTITWTAGPNRATAPVMVDGNITQPTAWWRLTHPWELGAP